MKRTIDFKKELIAKVKGGMRVSDLAIQYSVVKSTISIVFKNKDVVKEANVAKGVT